MRSRTPLALVLVFASPLAAASAHAGDPAAPAASAGAAHAPAGPPVPLCVQPDAEVLPLVGQVRDGPATVRAGDGPSGFTVRVHNTGRVTCHRVHPVVLLLDEDRALVPSQVRLDFHDGRRWLPVRLRHTSRNENVGVLDGGQSFHGFTVRPGGKKDVRLRLAVREDARPDRVAVQAALVQHHDRDGHWAGHSDTYTFELRGADGTRPSARPPRGERPADPPGATESPARPPGRPDPVPVPPSPWPLPDPWARTEPPSASRFPTEIPVRSGRPVSPPPSAGETGPASPGPYGSLPPGHPDADVPAGERPPRAQADGGRDGRTDAPGRTPETGSGEAPRHPGHESGKGRPELAETGAGVTSLGLLAAGLLVFGAAMLEVARRLRRA
ncbi:hypothetical protein [Streptomyces albidoflavus]|uniref:hypothetical protein n=1 Tax=Streptomyces albidoflavus TaxID=1886 RepID=UPI00101E5157|nr:hypothetical protein [Streptomyces albidoflavus]RZD88587.1 hypothetical protein C0Q63_09855 [Streptomyces albidoflavus]